MIIKRQYSIRDRLLYSFLMTAALMCIVVLYSFISTNSVAVSITNAYRTNVELNEFQTVLDRVESSMERYIGLRTFESIEDYFSWRGKLDSMALRFTTSLSDNPVLLQEYKTKKLMESFLEYADKAVYARRGNNVSEYSANYGSALRVYGYLTESVHNLNAMYFKRNISGYGVIFEDMKKVEVLSICILVLVVTVNFLMVYLLITRITGPLVDLSRAADRLAAGDFDVELFASQSRDEVGNICRAFDRMTVSIRDNIETIRENAAIESALRQRELEIRELYKDAQLKTLQAQINPHFLFNTLNAGAQLAMMEGADDTCTFIEKTADFFRYNIQNMDKDTVLSDEITLVDNYMYIMKVRFADRMNYIKDIKTDRLDIAMPSMVLQPLVENSVTHGISAMKSGGTITLRVFDLDGILNIEVSDNGAGFTPETRDKLLYGSYFSEQDSGDPLKIPSVGIGMINVITRLRMFFNDQKIFDIRDNADGPGTTFSIRIQHV